LQSFDFSLTLGCTPHDYESLLYSLYTSNYVIDAEH